MWEQPATGLVAGNVSLLGIVLIGTDARNALNQSSAPTLNCFTGEIVWNNNKAPDQNMLVFSRGPCSSSHAPQRTACDPQRTACDFQSQFTGFGARPQQAFRFCIYKSPACQNVLYKYKLLRFSFYRHSVKSESGMYSIRSPGWQFIMQHSFPSVSVVMGLSCRSLCSVCASMPSLARR